MKTIQKLSLTTQEKPQTLTFKEGYKVVRIEYLVTEKCICLWVETPLQADIPELRKTFIVRKTNQTVPEDYIHVHTAIDLLRPEAFHIFEVPEAATENLTPDTKRFKTYSPRKHLAA